MPFVTERDITQFTEPVWEQQTESGETNEQFAMFLRYADLRPSERSIARSWRAWVHGTDKARVTMPAQYEVLAQAFHWQERATTRDIFELKNRYRIWAEREWSVRDADFAIGEKLRQKALTHLEKIDDENYQMNVGEIASLLQMASNMQRGSIPSVNNLTSNQIREMLSMLPEDKRNNVLRIVAAEYGKPKQLMENTSTTEEASEVIEGDVVEVREEIAVPPPTPSPVAPAPAKAKGKPFFKQPRFAIPATDPDAELFTKSDDKVITIKAHTDDNQATSS